MSLLLTAGPFSSLPQITFYEGKCFTGRKLDVCGSCNSFQDQGFLNRVNSICVQSGAWVCFDHPDFRGQQYILEHGEYPDFYRWNGRSDHLGSCRPIGMVSGMLLLALALPAGALLGLVYPGHRSPGSKCHKNMCSLETGCPTEQERVSRVGLSPFRVVCAGHKAETASCVPRQEEDTSSSSHSEMQCL